MTQLIDMRKIKKMMVGYGPLLLNDVNEVESALPKLVLPAASLHPKLFDVLLVQIIV
jgi:hypothetical protein